MTTRTRPSGRTAASSAASRLARLLPIPAGAGLARMLVERNITAFRHGWIALVTGFAEPVFYLFSLGIGLGALVHDGDHRRRARRCPTRQFVAPALLAVLGDERRGLRLDLQRLLQAEVRQALRRGARHAAWGPATSPSGRSRWSLLRGDALLRGVPAGRLAGRDGPVVVGAAGAAGRDVHRVRVLGGRDVRARRSCGPGSTSTTSPWRSSRCSCSRRRSSRCRPTPTPCSGWCELHPALPRRRARAGLMLGDVGRGCWGTCSTSRCSGTVGRRRRRPPARAAAAVLSSGQPLLVRASWSRSGGRRRSGTRRGASVHGPPRTCVR